MKREKQFCAVWMNKHEWSLEEKKSLQRYIQEKKITKKNQEKKMNNCEISLKDKQNLCRPVVTCLNLS